MYKVAEYVKRENNAPCDVIKLILFIVSVNIMEGFQSSFSYLHLSLFFYLESKALR